MNAQTKLSAKGQVVIPKDVRDRLGLTEGTLFDVIERGGEVVLRRHGAQKSGLTAAEAFKEIQKFYRYDGPPVSIEEMDAAVLRTVAEDYRKSESRSR